jgi:hypothetical protein
MRKKISRIAPWMGYSAWARHPIPSHCRLFSPTMARRQEYRTDAFERAQTDEGDIKE